jgi:hypothetical protein
MHWALPSDRELVLRLKKVDDSSNVIKNFGQNKMITGDGRRDCDEQANTKTKRINLLRLNDQSDGARGIPKQLTKVVRFGMHLASVQRVDRETGYNNG